MMFDKIFRSKKNDIAYLESLKKIIAAIPTDIWHQIFLFLSIKDLQSAAIVSKKWEQMIMDPLPKQTESLFERADSASAQPWIEKIHQELTESPPIYSKNKALRYSAFYKKMKKANPPFITFQELAAKNGAEYDFFEFCKYLEFYINNRLDVRLREFLEDKPSLVSTNKFFNPNGQGTNESTYYATKGNHLYRYLNDVTNMDKIFSFETSHCFEVIVNFLINKCNFDINKRTFSKIVSRTLLHIAVANCREEYIDVLFKFGINFTARDKTSFTALGLAHIWGFPDLLTNLCKKIPDKEIEELNFTSHNFREKFQEKYGIPYNLYLQHSSQEEKQQDEFIKIGDKINYILQELTNKPDPKLVTLIYDVLQIKDPELLEKFKGFLEENRSSCTPWQSHSNLSKT